MKKILLTAATAAIVLSSSAYADKENMFYFAGDVGGDELTKTKSLKSRTGAFLSLGAGYYVMDNARVELAYKHLFDPKYKGNINGVSTKASAKADSILINGFVDLFDVSVAKIYAGVGGGLAMISGKMSDVAGTNVKFKKKNNFAWAVYLGSSAEISDGINATLTYSYADMGKTKKAGKNNTSINIKGHFMSVGFRFDV